MKQKKIVLPKSGKKNRASISYQFPVLLEEDIDGGYVVSCPFFEGCYTQGESVEEALKNIKEVILLCMEELEEKREIFSFPNIGLHLVEVKKQYA